MSFLFKKKNKAEFGGWTAPAVVRYEPLWNEGGLHEFVHDVMTQPAVVARDRARVMRMYTAVYDYTGTDGADLRSLQEKLHFALLDRTAALQSACREAATSLQLFANFLAGWRFWSLSERLISFVFRPVDDDWIPRYTAETSRTMGSKDGSKDGSKGSASGGQLPGDPQPVMRCSELFRAMWRENVAVPLALQMQDVAFELLARERAGDARMSAGLTTCLACFTRALDYASVSARFEDRYVRDTVAYCAAAQQHVAAAPDTAARVRLIGDIVARETANADARLRDACAARVKSTVTAAFVADNVADICAAFVPALRAYVRDDAADAADAAVAAGDELGRIYHLATLADTSAVFRNITTLPGAKPPVLLPPDQQPKRAWSSSRDGDGDGDGNGGKVSTKSVDRLCRLFRRFAAATMNETLDETLAQPVPPGCAGRWEQLVDVLVRQHSRFTRLVQCCFRGNSAFAAALEDVFKKLLESYEHSDSTSSGSSNGAAKGEHRESLTVVLVKYCDRVLRRRKKGALTAEEVRARLESVMCLFRYAEDKDTFMTLYAKCFAQRVLNKTSVGLDSEVAMVLLLRREQGAAYTARLEQMLADHHANLALARGFGHYAALQHQALPPLDVVAVSRSSWPVAAPAACSGAHLPPCVAAWLGMYDAFFQRECPGRALQHVLQHARADVRYNLTDSRSVLLVLNGVQATVLTQYTRARTTLALRELEQLTGIPLAALRAHLRPLVVARLLTTTDYALAAPDAALALNPRFRVPDGTERVSLLPDAKDGARLKALAAKKGHGAAGAGPSAASASAASAAADEEGGVLESDERLLEMQAAEREHVVQAAVARVLKRERTVPFARLVALVGAAVHDRFPATEPIVRAAVAALAQLELAKPNAQGDTVEYVL